MSQADQRDALYVLTRIRRLTLKSGESAGPLDHEESVASLAAALEMEPGTLRSEVDAALAVAPLEGESNPVVKALALDAIVCALPEVHTLGGVPNPSDHLS